jgi:hypothetical protein
MLFAALTTTVANKIAANDRKFGAVVNFYVALASQTTAESKQIRLPFEISNEVDRAIVVQGIEALRKLTVIRSDERQKLTGKIGKKTSGRTTEDTTKLVQFDQETEIKRESLFNENFGLRLARQIDPEYAQARDRIKLSSAISKVEQAEKVAKGRSNYRKTDAMEDAPLMRQWRGIVWEEFLKYRDSIAKTETSGTIVKTTRTLSFQEVNILASSTFDWQAVVSKQLLK